MLFQTWCMQIIDEKIFLINACFSFVARYYPWIDLTKPDAFSLNGINVYEQTEANVNVGIW